MKTLFIMYPGCSTCRNAESFLKNHQIDYERRHIVDATPTAEELKAWLDMSGLPIKKLFNTSGKVYQALNLKEALTTMEESKMLDLLATNGMLIKRPLLIQGDKMLVGFRADAYDAFFS